MLDCFGAFAFKKTGRRRRTAWRRETQNSKAETRKKPEVRFLPALQPLPPGVAGIQFVPELDVLLVLLPAQEDFFPAKMAGKSTSPR